MDSLLMLLHRHPLIFLHMVTAIGTLLFGAVILARRKGTAGHRTLGWCWVLLMGGTALSSAFIRDPKLPNLAGYTPIHLLTLAVALMLPLAIWQVRRGNLRAHRRLMQGMYIGGCLLAGAFTLLPGRFLGSLLWGVPMSGIAA